MASSVVDSVSGELISALGLLANAIKLSRFFYFCRLAVSLQTSTKSVMLGFAGLPPIYVTSYFAIY